REVGTTTFTTGSTAVGVTFADITGLAANTAYEFQVQSKCSGATTSTFSGLVSFRTLCGPVTTLPYTEGFEGTTGTALPACWTLQDANNDLTTWVTTSTNARTGTRAARINYHASNATNDWLFTP